MKKHADAAHWEVISHQGEYPETQFEMTHFSRIWQSPQRTRDWMLLHSQGERYEAVSTLLNTCRTFLVTFDQGRFERQLQDGMPYQIDSHVAENLVQGDRMATYQQLTETDCRFLRKLAPEWLKLYNSIGPEIRQVAQDFMY